MSCGKCNNCKNKLPCSVCGDTPYSTPSSCTSGTTDCPNPDPCAETFSDACIVHTGDEIVDTGIATGDRLDVILQRLSLFVTNPGCITPGSTCLSVLGLKSTYITSNTIKLSWLPSSTATGYTVEYKPSSSSSWTLNPSIGLPDSPTDSIGGLTSGTDYDIRVSSTCSSGSCYSVTIKVTTLTS